MSITQGMGARVLRVEDDHYLMGHTNFIDGMVLPDMLAVAFLRSNDAHARIRSVDVENALAQPGVACVMTAEEANALCKPIRADRTGEEEQGGYHPTDYPVMARDKIRYVGEIIAAVVADDRYLAEDALEHIVLETEPLEAVASIGQALRDGAPLVHEELGNNIHYQGGLEFGDVDEAFERAHLVVEAELKTDRQCASPMEGRAVLARYDRSEDRLTVWSSTQMPHLVRTKIAELLEYPEHKLRVVAPDVGGGFGLKCHIFPEELIVPALALRLQRPVKWLEDRRENYLAGFHAKDEAIKVAIALDADGVIQAMDATFVNDGGAYTSYPFTPSAEPAMATWTLPGPYRNRTYRAKAVTLYTNKSTHAVCRGVGQPISSYAVEHTLDLAAHKLGLDPVELRRRNLLTREDFPYTLPIGLSYDSASPIESLDQALELVDYEGFREEQAAARQQERYLGIGIAPMIELTVFGHDLLAPGGLNQNITLYESAHIRVDPDGGITLSVGTHSHGQGHATTFAQLVASELACPLDKIRFVDGDTDQTPYGSGTWGSRGAVAGGGAVLRASREIKEKALLVAAHLLEVRPEDVSLTDDGTFEPRGAPTRAVSWNEVARAAVRDTNLPPGVDAGLEVTASYTARTVYSYATHIVTVEVDPGTGQVTLLRYIVSEDCGRMINPMVVDGQVMGGVVQGLGSALLEQHCYDEYGQLMTATMMDYLLPTAPEMPPFTIGHMETESPWTEGGIKGMGEGGSIAALPAVANAVSDALSPLCGWRLMDELPITPERVFRALREGKQGGD